MRIETADRAGREWVLRNCARQPFVLDRLRETDPERLLYESTKPASGGIGPLLTPLELLDRLAAWRRRRAFTATATSPLRCARANGRSPEISGTTADGWSWPKAPGDEQRLDDRYRRSTACEVLSTQSLEFRTRC